MATLTTILSIVMIQHVFSSSGTVCVNNIKLKRDMKLENKALGNLKDIGPLMCMRECLSRRACKSTNYNEQHFCQLNYENNSKEHLVSSPGYAYMDKSDFNSMDLISPCNDTYCSLKEKCVVVHNGTPACVITECYEPKQKLHCNISNSDTWMVGATVNYTCRYDNGDLYETQAQCKADGNWWEDLSCPHTHIVNKQLAICFNYERKKTTHNDAKNMCKHLNNLPAEYMGRSHLLVVDSREKFDFIKQLGNVTDCMWIDGEYRHNAWKTWKGDLSELAYNANAFVDPEGCMGIYFGEITHLHCHRNCAYICEIYLS